MTFYEVNRFLWWQLHNSQRPRAGTFSLAATGAGTDKLLRLNSRAFTSCESWHTHLSHSRETHSTLGVVAGDIPKVHFFLATLKLVWTQRFGVFVFFQISHQRIQVFLDHRDPLHIADLLSHHPLSHIWVPATVTMTTPLKLDRRWLHGPACEKQSDSLLLSLLPFFAPSLLRFVAYLKPSQLLNRLHRKLHLFILFSALPERFDAVLGFFAVKAASFTAKMMTQKVPLFLWSFWWLLLVMPVCVCMCYTSKLYMFQFTH